MKLFKHQEDGLKRTVNFNRVAYYWEMGTGKTFVGSEKLMSFGTRVNLVVCQKSKVDDWVNHFVKHYLDFKHDVVDLTGKIGFEYFTKSCVKNKDCVAVGIINYDLLYRRPELLKLKDFTLMLDESSLIQNETTKRCKFVLKMKPANVILLSGTPTSGRYERLYSQIKLLGWDISKRDYWNRYINWEYVQFGRMPFPVKQVTNYRDVEGLKQQLRLHGADFLKADESSLPSQTFIDELVDCDKNYRKFMKSGIITVNDVELVGDNSLKKLLYARQLCGAYNNNKLKAFEDLINSTEDRILVFYNFNVELDALKEITKDRPLSFVNGSNKDLEAYENEDNSITFIQYQSGAFGLNLQKANKIIYYTLPLSSELYEQSKKRTHRIGQDKPCFYYNLICKNSVEEKIKETLALRKDYNEKLFEEDYSC